MFVHGVYSSRKWARLTFIFLVVLCVLTAYSCFGAPKHSISIVPHDFYEILATAESLAPAAVSLQTNSMRENFSQNIHTLIGRINGYSVVPVPADKEMRTFLKARPEVYPPLGVGIASSVISNKTSVTAFFNVDAKLGSLIALTVIGNARLGVSPDAVITSLHPLRQDQNSLLEALKRVLSTQDGGTSHASAGPICVAVFAILYFSFNFLGPLLEEKQTNFKHQQLLTGMNVTIYWLAVVAFNFLLYVLICCGAVAIYWYFDVLESYLEIICCLLLNFWVLMPLYCGMSCLGQIASALMMSLSILLLIFAYVCQSILLVIRSASSAIWSWCWFWCILFCFGSVLWIFLAVKETRRISQKSRKSSLQETKSEDEEDADVAEERKRMDCPTENELRISVRDLNKYFKKLHAVKNLTFGVRTNECFGLLGANGAGKTVTFDILTGLAMADGGSAIVNGHSSSRVQEIGFCPQFDALLGDLTARETLNLMVTLRGYPDFKERVENVLAAVSLKENADQLIRRLSGGQRRRLSVGLALLSQTKVIFLDEPTAGIDPKTRRQLWDVLSAMRKEGYAILLTSHSMEECEALCSRIGMMDKGALIAIGAPQHIKSRFGEGYTMTFTLRDESTRDELLQAVSARFPKAVIKTLQPSTRVVWHLPKTSEDRWSQLFDDVHQFASSQQGVTDYSLAQATLEEAFSRLMLAEDESMAVRACSRVPQDISPLV